MWDVLTCTPSSSRSSGASRSVMTLHRRPRRLAATLNLTGALSREMLPPERSLPVSVPSATTPLAVARKLVIFACIESDDDVAALAAAGTANARMAAIAASMAVRGLMRSAVPILRIVRIVTFHIGPRGGARSRSRSTVLQRQPHHLDQESLDVSDPGWRGCAG